MRYTAITTFAACLALATIANAADDDVQKLAADVASDNKEVCLCAIDDLGKLGAKAKSAVPALVKAVCCDDSETCWHAARALGAIGPDAEDAVPELVSALGHDDPNVRAYAAFALGRIGNDSKEVVKALIDKAFDEELAVRRACMRAILALDPPVEDTRPTVLQILEEGDSKIIMPALHTLAEEGRGKDGAEVVKRLSGMLEHEKGCYWACLVLAEIGEKAAAAVPDLGDVLDNEDPLVRLQALITLGEIGSASGSQLPKILELYNVDEFKGARYAAAFALSKIGLSDESKKALQETLDDEDPFLQMVSAWALAKSDPGDKAMVQRAVDLIVAGFKSKDEHLRRMAANAAIEFDVPAKDVVPALVDALSDEDPDVVLNAIDALAEFGSEALVRVDESLKNKKLRPYAILLIRRLGDDAASAVPALIEALKQEAETEDDLMFRREVQFALAAIGPKSQPAVAVLLSSLKSDREEIRASACFALGRIGPSAVQAVRSLLDLESDESEMVQLAALFALVKIQPDVPTLARRAAVGLMKALGSEDERYRAGAALALGELSKELGELGRRAIPRLEQLRDDENESPLVRDMAAEALEKFKG